MKKVWSDIKIEELCVDMTLGGEPVSDMESTFVSQHNDVINLDGTAVSNKQNNGKNPNGYNTIYQQWQQTTRS